MVAAPPAHELLAAALEGLPEAVLVTDAAERTVYVNAAFTTLTGYSPGDMEPRSWRVLHGPETAEDDVAAILGARTAGTSYRGRILHYRKDGRPFWCGLSIAPLPTADGSPAFFIALLRDISDRVMSQAHLVQLLSDVEQAHGTADALLHVARSLPQARSTSEVTQAVAQAIPELCEADRSAVALWDEADGRLSITALHGWQGPLEHEARAYTLRPAESPELAAMLQHPSPVLVDRTSASAWATGALEHFEISAFVAIPVLSEHGLQGLLVAYWTDAAPPPTVDGPLRERLAGLAGLTAVALENVRLFEQVRHLADHDSLTGLPNRALLTSHLARALAAGRDDAAVAVIFCDIDQLKQINDSMGHAVGDKVLQEVGARLAALIGAHQLVARVGGDEFVVVLQSVRTDDEVDELLDRMQATIAVPIELQGRHVSLRLSAGAIVARQGEDGRPWTPESVLQAADQVMYERRLLGAGAPGTPRRSLTEDLAGALLREEITAVFQPVVDLRSGRIVAVEALARWMHPSLGTLMPDRFIPLAELTGTVHEIGSAVLRRGCQLLSRVSDAFPRLQLAINVSAAQFSRDLASEVLAALDRCDLDPDRLTLEVTESLLVEDHQAAPSQLRHLRRQGVGIAADDFGTGYTGIRQLRHLPVSELKIDRSFLEPRAADEPDYLAALVGLGRALGLRTVIEGVESEQQHRRVVELGFDRAQGFLYGRPMTAADLIAALHRSERPAGPA